MRCFALLCIGACYCLMSFSSHQIFAFDSEAPKLEQLMTVEEFQWTGITKLSTVEKEALEQWLGQNGLAFSKASQFIPANYQIVTRVWKSSIWKGSQYYFMLSDGSYWRAQDLGNEEEWERGMDVCVEANEDHRYHFAKEGAKIRVEPVLCGDWED